MTSSSMPKQPPCAFSGPEERAPAAFGLVEIAISLGIIAFVMISLLGLMVVGLDAGKLSHEDTVIAAMAKTVLTDVRTNSYASLAGMRETRYFEFDGMPVSGTVPAHYVCSIENAPHAIDPSVAVPGVTGHSIRLRIVFSSA